MAASGPVKITLTTRIIASFHRFIQSYWQKQSFYLQSNTVTATESPCQSTVECSTVIYRTSLARCWPSAECLLTIHRPLQFCQQVPTQSAIDERGSRVQILIKLWPTLYDKRHIQLFMIPLWSRSTMYYVMSVPYTRGRCAASCSQPWQSLKVIGTDTDWLAT